MIGRVLGFLYAAGMYRNVSRTANIEATRLQLEWDVLTPEQKLRVGRAQLARKRNAAVLAQRRSDERMRKLKLYGPRVAVWFVASAIHPALGFAVIALFVFLAWRAKKITS